MQLPFTREQFFDLFVAYNEALWPAAVATLGIFSVRRTTPEELPAGRVVSGERV